MDNLDKKVFELFSGRVVPKGATKKLRTAQMSLHMYWNIYWGHIAPPMMRKK